MSRRVIVSRDGARLSCWSNDGQGVPVILCNGLGAPVEAWLRALGVRSGGDEHGK